MFAIHSEKPQVNVNQRDRQRKGQLFTGNSHPTVNYRVNNLQRFLNKAAPPGHFRCVHTNRIAWEWSVQGGQSSWLENY